MTAPRTAPDMSLALAEQLLAGAREEAERRGLALGIAVVDRAGQLVAAVRMDAAQHIALRLATDKAWTASACGQPTEHWSDSSQPGGSDWGITGTLGGRFVVFAGGLPVVVDGSLLGGIGVSGAAAEVDQACARAGMDHAGLGG